MLTRLSDGETKRTATDGRSWSFEAMEALLYLLVKMRPDVCLMTPQEDGSYWCDLASMFDPVKRGRSTQVNVSPSESHTGILRNAYWVRNLTDKDAVLGVDLMDYYTFRDPIISTKLKLSSQTLVEVKYANWSSPRKFTKDEIAEAVRLFSREQPDEAWPSRGAFDPPTPWLLPAVTSTSSSGTFMGIGAKTVEGGMIPPSVYKGPPVEPKSKKKWWKR